MMSGEIKIKVVEAVNFRTIEHAAFSRGNMLTLIEENNRAIIENCL
jgi:hypothetical protein